MTTRYFLAAVLVTVALGMGAVGGETAAVVRVVDGDTIEVKLGGRAESVRLIGVDTPETVDPRKMVEYFGVEASNFTKSLESILQAHGTGKPSDRMLIAWTKPRSPLRLQSLSSLLRC